MSSSINICSMNRVHPENALEPPPATATSPTKSTGIISCIVVLCMLLGLSFFVLGFSYLAVYSLDKYDQWNSFSTFKVESLSLVSPYNTSEEHWNITLRVGNPRPNTHLGPILSYNVSHVYLSLHGQLIAIGDMSAFNLESEILVNGTLNAILSHPENQILRDLGHLWLNIVVPVTEVGPTQGQEVYYSTLTVSCLSFRHVISSSSAQGIQLQSGKCLSGFYPRGVE